MFGMNGVACVVLRILFFVLCYVSRVVRCVKSALTLCVVVIASLLLIVSVLLSVSVRICVCLCL
jgi:hypothetical protein